jgi:hypothetical protein
MSNLTGIIINDCNDGLARTRQELRFSSLLGSKPSFLGVGSYSPVEAAGSFVDVLDVLVNFPAADKDRENIVLINVAPRGEDTKKLWENGTPFCYFRVGKTVVLSAYEEYCLSLWRDLGIVDKVEILDVPSVTSAAVKWGDLEAAEAEKINNSQFRSLELLPLAALWLRQGKPVPTRTQSLKDLPAAKSLVWHIDNFGNAKTTLLPENVGFEQGKKVALGSKKTAVCYHRLADVPKGLTSLIIGSSGYGQKRFLEIAVGHRGRASDLHGLAVGSPVFEESFVINSLNR